MSNKIFLITGANRGIGRGLVSGFLSRNDTTVIAAVRNTSDPTSLSLQDIPRGSGSKIEILRLNEDSDYKNLVANLAARGLHRIDVVIANAGSSSGWKPILKTSPDEVLEDLAANSMLPVRTFNASWPLLEKSGYGAKFVVMGSVLGSSGNLDNMNVPGLGYGMSKASVHFFGKKLALDFKDKGLHVGIIHPGWTRTSMGNDLANAIGAGEAAVSLENSVEGCIKVIDQLNETTSGQFQAYNGDSLPW